MMSSGLKTSVCVEDISADFGEREAVARGVEILQPARGLDGLEGHAAHARLLQREVDDAAEFLVVGARSTVTTSVVEMLCPFRCSSACWRMRRRSAPRSCSSGSAPANRTAGRARSRACSCSRLAKSWSCAMRMPLVLTIRCLIGRRFAASRMSKNCG